MLLMCRQGPGGSDVTGLFWPTAGQQQRGSGDAAALLFHTVRSDQGVTGRPGWGCTGRGVVVRLRSLPSPQPSQRSPGLPCSHSPHPRSSYATTPHRSSARRCCQRLATSARRSPLLDVNEGPASYSCRPPSHHLRASFQGRRSYCEGDALPLWSELSHLRFEPAAPPVHAGATEPLLGTTTTMDWACPQPSVGRCALPPPVSMSRLMRALLLLRLPHPPAEQHAELPPQGYMSAEHGPVLPSNQHTYDSHLENSKI
ncbi:unnamed protein product [Boreogadus saida]